jgi:hypothetical protein
LNFCLFYIFRCRQANISSIVDSVNDTGEKIIGGIVGTAEQFFGGVIDTGDKFWDFGYKRVSLTQGKMLKFEL